MHSTGRGQEPSFHSVFLSPSIINLPNKKYKLNTKNNIKNENKTQLTKDLKSMNLIIFSPDETRFSFAALTH